MKTILRQKIRDFYGEHLDTVLHLQQIWFLGKGGCLFGGAIRDIMLDVPPNDLDIVVHKMTPELAKYLQKFPYKENYFGGYKIQTKEFEMDVWSLEEHWAFQKGHVCNDPVSFDNLPKTTFLNINAVAAELNLVSLNIDIVENGFFDCIKNKQLDINLEKTKNIQYSLFRAFRFFHQFNFSLSLRLRKHFQNHGICVDAYLKYQMKNFGKIIYDKEYIDNWYIHTIL